MKNKQGFTLIELVATLVIIGILAVAAAPRFIDLRADAEAAVVHGIKASIASTSTLTLMAAALNRNSSGQSYDAIYAATWNIPGVGNVPTHYGSPWPNWHMSFNILFSHHDQIAMPGSGSSGVSSDRNLQCSGAEYCVQVVGNAPDFRPPDLGASARFWGVYFVPDGYRIDDNCFAFYGLDIENNGVRHRPAIKANVSGC